MLFLNLHCTLATQTPGICSTSRMPLQQLSAKWNPFKVHCAAEKRGWCFLRAAKPRSLVLSSPTSANGGRAACQKAIFQTFTFNKYFSNSCILKLSEKHDTVNKKVNSYVTQIHTTRLIAALYNTSYRLTNPLKLIIFQQCI